MKHVNEKKSKKGEPKAGIGTRLVDTAAYTALGGCVGGLGGAVAKSLGLLSFLKPVVGLIGSTKLGAVVMAGTGGVLPMAVLGGAGVGGVLWGIAKAFQNFSSNEAAITHKEILAKKL